MFHRIFFGEVANLPDIFSETYRRCWPVLKSEAVAVWSIPISLEPYPLIAEVMKECEDELVQLADRHYGEGNWERREHIYRSKTRCKMVGKNDYQRHLVVSLSSKSEMAQLVHFTNQAKIQNEVNSYKRTWDFSHAMLLAMGKNIAGIIPPSHHPYIIANDWDYALEWGMISGVVLEETGLKYAYRENTRSPILEWLEENELGDHAIITETVNERGVIKGTLTFTTPTVAMMAKLRFS